MTDPMGTLDDVTLATARLLTTCGRLGDADLTAPSLLPGWTRGHVLAHIARNADSLVNLLTWARTGVETPQYPSQQARDADIEAGATRTVAEQVADLEATAKRFHSAALELSGDAWDAVVRKRGGGTVTARKLPWSRLREVEIHHADLAAGYGFPDWPDRFVRRLLPEVVADFTGRDDVPVVRLRTVEADTTIGGDGRATTVAGEDHAVLAWLIGRSDGGGLTVEPSGTLPALPAWR